MTGLLIAGDLHEVPGLTQCHGQEVSWSAMAKEHRPARWSKHRHTLGPRGQVTRSPTYSTWRSMLARCKHAYMNKFYPGITVCERWREFANFLADMGERPTGKTIDRYPNRAGNYEPGNCRWATASEQAQNRRTTKITRDLAEEVLGRREHGESRTSIAIRLGVSYHTVWDIERGRSWPDVARSP